MDALDPEVCFQTCFLAPRVCRSEALCGSGVRSTCRRGCGQQRCGLAATVFGCFSVFVGLFMRVFDDTEGCGAVYIDGRNTGFSCTVKKLHTFYTKCNVAGHLIDSMFATCVCFSPCMC